jgi:hypothetical protein
LRIIVTLGNCQAQRLGAYIEEANDDYKNIFLSASNAVAPIPSVDEIRKAISLADLVNFNH